jgi:hypothetical protein
MTHTITGGEPFLHRTLASIGIPPLHILRAYNAEEYRFYELTDSVSEILHFSHFKKTVLTESSLADSKIRLGEELIEEIPPVESHKTRISFLDD